MRDLERTLEELRRLGLHLDPDEAAAARARRRARLNTWVYPLYRLVGFQLLIAAVVIHNLAVFGRPGGWAVAVFALVSEAYCGITWLALRRWFESFGPMAGWDLSDLLFVADLVLWAGAIHVTGGPQSLIFFLPLLRVADHRAAAKAMAFAHLAPLSYLGVVVLAAVDGGVVWGVEVSKLVLLYLAGLYIVWTGRPAQRIREEREAALAAAAGFVSRLRERTERLDEANRLRATLLERLGTGLRGSLVRIVGFSRYLLEQQSLDDRTQRFVLRIHDAGTAALRELDATLDPAAHVSPGAEILVGDVLRETAIREVEQSDAGPFEPARLVLPSGEAAMHGDRRRLATVLGHVLAAGRHVHGAAPTLELELASETGVAERVIMHVARVTAGPPGKLFDPFAADTHHDHSERIARLKLSMARVTADELGYRLEAESTASGTEIRLSFH